MDSLIYVKVTVKSKGNDKYVNNLKKVCIVLCKQCFFVLMVCVM